MLEVYSLETRCEVELASGEMLELCEPIGYYSSVDKAIVQCRLYGKDKDFAYEWDLTLTYHFAILKCKVDPEVVATSISLVTRLDAQGKPMLRLRYSLNDRAMNRSHNGSVH